MLTANSASVAINVEYWTPPPAVLEAENRHIRRKSAKIAQIALGLVRFEPKLEIFDSF